MSKTKTRKGLKTTLAKPEAPDDVPQFFRLNVEVSDLDAPSRSIRTSSESKGGSSRGTDATSSVAP